MSPRHPDVELSKAAHGRPVEEVYRAVVGNDKRPSYSDTMREFKLFHSGVSGFWHFLELEGDKRVSTL